MTRLKVGGVFWRGAERWRAGLHKRPACNPLVINYRGVRIRACQASRTGIPHHLLHTNTPTCIHTHTHTPTGIYTHTHTHRHAVTNTHSNITTRTHSHTHAFQHTVYTDTNTVTVTLQDILCKLMWINNIRVCVCVCVDGYLKL